MSGNTNNPRSISVPTLRDADGRPICDKCGEYVNPNGDGVWRHVLGFVQNRQGGGAHGISDSIDLGQYRHAACHRYIDNNQEVLF